MVKRNSAIDILRAGLMFLIVMHHCWRHGIFYRPDSLLEWIFTMSIIWHVDCFVAISGWFGIRFSLYKFVKLYGVIFFYSILNFVYESWSTGEWTIRNFEIVSGWFGSAYLMLMLVSTLLNEAIEGAVKKGTRAAWCAYALFAVGFVFNWAPRGLFSGISVAGPLSLFTLVFIYVTMRMVRLLIPDEQLKKVVCVGLILFPVVTLCFVALTVRWPRFICMGGYNAPHVWMFAVATVAAIAKWGNVSSWFGSLCVRISPLIFGVYVLHNNTTFGKLLYIIPERLLASVLPPVCIMPIVASMVFCLCIFVEFIRHCFVRCIIRIVEKQFVFSGLSIPSK